MSQLLEITDRTDTARTAIVDTDTVAPVVSQWLAADGAPNETTHNVDALVKAIRRGDWTSVHAIADHLSFSVDVLA